MEKPLPIPALATRSPSRRWRAWAAWASLVLAGAGAAQAVAAQTQPSETADSEELTISADAVLAPWTGDLDGMIDRRVVRLLTVYSKTYYFMDRAVARGMVQDFGRLLEDYLNEKLKAQGKLERKNVKLRVIIIPVARDELLPALVAGKGDIASATLTVTEARQQDVDFTAAMYPNVSELVVSGPAADPVSSVDDLAGKQFFVRKSSSYYESLKELNRRFKAEKKRAVKIKAAPETLEDEDLLEMVNAGLVPYVVVDEPKADFWAQIFPNVKVHKSIALRTGGKLAPAIRKGSPELKAVLDEFAATYRKGSLEGNMILTRYLKNTAYLKDATSESERRKFLELMTYFQKYAEQYDVDWVLMVAQGFQESQLDHAVRSPVGAIGVMQVMPATGKDLGVGDITELETNIHAGIKYMRWMIDQYYADEPMTRLDKALFSFASYNAGAGRIAGLRSEAKKRGLDPNVWFRNVEYVAAEKIGAETVTYVANIYKYYIAYRLLLDARAERGED